MVWIGAATAIQVFGILTKRAADPAKSAFFARNVSFTVNRVLLPTALVVLAAGIGLVENGNWDWSEPFVLWGLILWAAVAVVAFGFLGRAIGSAAARLSAEGPSPERSEEHTSELQSQSNLVCRLLLEKKKITKIIHCHV